MLFILFDFFPLFLFSSVVREFQMRWISGREAEQQQQLHMETIWMARKVRRLFFFLDKNSFSMRTRAGAQVDEDLYLMSVESIEVFRHRCAPAQRAVSCMTTQTWSFSLYFSACKLTQLRGCLLPHQTESRELHLKSFALSRVLCHHNSRLLQPPLLHCQQFLCSFTKWILIHFEVSLFISRAQHTQQAREQERRCRVWEGERLSRVRQDSLWFIAQLKWLLLNLRTMMMMAKVGRRRFFFLLSPHSFLSPLSTHVYTRNETCSRLFSVFYASFFLLGGKSTSTSGKFRICEFGELSLVEVAAALCCCFRGGLTMLAKGFRFSVCAAICEEEGEREDSVWKALESDDDDELKILWETLFLLYTQHHSCKQQVDAHFSLLPGKSFSFCCFFLFCHTFLVGSWAEPFFVWVRIAPAPFHRLINQVRGIN